MSPPSRGLAPREDLECLLVKMGCTGPLVEPRRGPQAGKSGDPRSQDTDTGNAYEEDSVMKFLSYPSLDMEKGIIKPVLTVNVSQSF